MQVRSFIKSDLTEEEKEEMKAAMKAHNEE